MNLSYKEQISAPEVDGHARASKAMFFVECFKLRGRVWVQHLPFPFSLLSLSQKISMPIIYIQGIVELARTLMEPALGVLHGMLKVSP